MTILATRPGQGPAHRAHGIFYVQRRPCRLCDRCGITIHVNVSRPTVSTLCADCRDLDRTCPRGHTQTEETVYISPRGHSECRLCKVTKYRARRAGEAA